MDEKSTKTSPKQRIFIGIIAFILVASMIASYAAIIVANSNSSSSTTSSTGDTAKMDKLYAEYEAVQEEINTAAVSYSDQYYSEFSAYQSEVKAYNEEAANETQVQTTDLKTGTGRELTEDDLDYMAYYIGWCADETVFDTSISDGALKAPIDASSGLIDGWNTGVVGMKLGGVREITIPGELAYGDSYEICGGYNKPLKFVVMALERTGTLADLFDKANEISIRYQYASYGLDYDEIMNSSSDEEETTSGE